MIWDDFRGHQWQVEMFRRAIARNRTASGYLLIGPRGVGKREFVHRLAQCLFCRQIPDAQLDACGECSACKQVRAGTHPDLLGVACPDGKRELPIELLVGAADRRGREGLCHDLALRPMSAGRRIAIIDDADLMNEASANALLKTLEEPPPGAILFLLTPDTESILPTIRSRCQSIRFAPLSPTDVTDLLLKTGLVQDRSNAEEIAPLCEGSLETAQELADAGLRQLRTALVDALSTRPMNSLSATAALSAALEKISSETSEQRRALGWILHFAVNYFQQQLRQTDDPDELDRLGMMIDRSLESESHLKQAMPVPLNLEGLLDELARISRGAIPLY